MMFCNSQPSLYSVDDGHRCPFLAIKRQPRDSPPGKAVVIVPRYPTVRDDSIRQRGSLC